MIANVIVLLIILVLFVGAITYIVRAKKRGVRCIGCSQSGCCTSQKEASSECSCGCQSEQNN